MALGKEGQRHPGKVHAAAWFTQGLGHMPTRLCKARWMPCVKSIANGNLLYGSGNSNRGSVSTQTGGEREMGGGFKREGIYVYLWLIYAEVRQKTTKFCKAITPSI